MNRFIAWVAANETSMFQIINQQWRNKLFDFILPKLTHLGGATATVSTMLSIVLVLGNPLREWAIEALLSLAVSHLFVHLLKKKYRRERPYLKLANVHLGSHPLKDYSFPSGHTTAVFSICVVFALHSLLLAVLLLPLALIVGWSRVYLGLHYPTDCIIGAMLGTVSSLLAVYGVLLFL